MLQQNTVSCQTTDCMLPHNTADCQTTNRLHAITLYSRLSNNQLHATTQHSQLLDNQLPAFYHTIQPAVGQPTNCMLLHNTVGCQTTNCMLPHKGRLSDNRLQASTKYSRLSDNQFTVHYHTMQPVVHYLLLDGMRNIPIYLVWGC